MSVMSGRWARVIKARSVRLAGVCCCALVLMPAVAAHEFWIEPHQFQLTTADRLVADIRVGQMLTGNTQFYLPDKFIRFELIQGEQRRPVNSRTGDLPAVDETGLSEGLVILAYQSADLQLHYNKADKFLKFLDYEGINWVLKAHQQRGLPAEGFNEVYRRYAKSLLKIGAGQGEDQVLGMPLELILSKNPYQHNDDHYQVRLLWEGKPFANSQISVFFRADTAEADTGSAVQPEVQRSLVFSDQNGMALIPRPAQSGVLLLNAVQMIEADAELAQKTKAVWVSLWASTTFYVERKAE